jgi:hypothetical protein
VVAGPDGHLHADVIPPVKTRADRQDDPVLWGRLVGSRGHEQAGAPDSIWIELLDDDPVEQRTKLIAHDERPL